MGVKGLNKYIKENIRPKYRYWKLDKNFYHALLQNEFVDKNALPEKINNKTKDTVNLIVDAYSYYFILADEINWFIYDNLDLLKLLEKQLQFFLAIENLGKIVFVFDGIDIPLKEETEIIRRNDKIICIEEFFKSVTISEHLNKKKKNAPKMIIPSPLAFMTFIQFLLDFGKLYDNIEIKFTLLEADSYIAELANKYNGYVLSNDSDFFIYQSPGYINIKSLVFPKEYKELGDNPNGMDFIIKFELYTNQQILYHFSLTMDTLPLFATLCGNDYFKVENYPKLKQHLRYRKYSRRQTDSINFFIYKNIVNFILDMMDRIRKTEIPTMLNEYDDLTDQQKLIIEKMIYYKPMESNADIDLDFKITLINTVRQYNLSSKNNSINEELKICVGNYEESLKPKILSLNKDLLNSYYSGSLYSQLMDVLIKNQFECSQYFEDINKLSCWNITSNIRKRMYEIMLVRNFGEEKSRNMIYPIEEISREGSEVVKNNIQIHYADPTKLFDSSIDNRFIEYLTILNSNIKEVKTLPHYLIPLAASLRFLLNEKIKSNSFIYNKNDKIYETLSNKINHEDDTYTTESITKLYYYELEALLASSIAALTFTFLNISQNTEEIFKLPQEEISFTINNNRIKNNDNGEDNAKKINITKSCQNMYYNLRRNKDRSLQLKNKFGMESLQKNRNRLENAIQIYAEFRNILIMNSYLLQTLRLINDRPEFTPFFSMYHYLWEEAFYNMIDFFKIENEKNISFIFNHLYQTNSESEETTKNYINILENIYYRILDVIVK